MIINIGRMLLILFVLTLAVGCQQKIKQRQLPEEPPKEGVLEFTGPEEGWPPRPKDVTNVKEVPWEEIPGSLTDSLEAEIRQAALQDTRVRELLGDRFAYISIYEIELDKESERDPSKPLATKLTFFSHTNNVAVEVRIQGLKVDAVTTNERYQPPEGDDEIKEAIELAQNDSRLREEIKGLKANAILAFIAENQPGFGHRVLHVSFLQEEEDFPRFFAMVDLNDQKVLSAGPVPETERR